jgi:hypothetical protein
MGPLLTDLIRMTMSDSHALSDFEDSSFEREEEQRKEHTQRAEKEKTAALFRLVTRFAQDADVVGFADFLTVMNQYVWATEQAGHTLLAHLMAQMPPQVATLDAPLHPVETMVMSVIDKVVALEEEAPKGTLRHLLLNDSGKGDLFDEALRHGAVGVVRQLLSPTLAGAADHPWRAARRWPAAQGWSALPLLAGARAAGQEALAQVLEGAQWPEQLQTPSPVDFYALWRDREALARSVAHQFPEMWEAPFDVPGLTGRREALTPLEALLWHHLQAEGALNKTRILEAAAQVKAHRGLTDREAGLLAFGHEAVKVAPGKRRTEVHVEPSWRLAVVEVTERSWDTLLACAMAVTEKVATKSRLSDRLVSVFGDFWRAAWTDMGKVPGTPETALPLICRAWQCAPLLPSGDCGRLGPWVRTQDPTLWAGALLASAPSRLADSWKDPAYFRPVIQGNSPAEQHNREHLAQVFPDLWASLQAELIRDRAAALRPTVTPGRRGPRRS